MRTISTLFFIVGSLVPILSAQVPPAKAAIDKEKEAVTLFQQGSESYAEKRWVEARRLFYQSWRSIQHPKSAFMVAMTNVKLEQPKHARVWAQAAINATYKGIKLTFPYDSDAREIISWADESLKKDKDYHEISYNVDAKGDHVERTVPVPRIENPPRSLDLNVAPTLRPSVNITGVWRSNEGTLYNFKQDGNRIWAIEASAPNTVPRIVLNGSIPHDKMVINANWINMSKAGVSGNATIKMENDTLTVTKVSDGLQKIKWQRLP